MLVLGAAVAAVCLRSLVHHGYLLQVDAVYGPVRPAPTWGFYAPVLLTEDVLSRSLGAAAVGDMYVVAALFVCTAGPMILLREKPWFAQCAAGLLGGLNPWVYDRVVEGQWGVAAGGGALFIWLATWEQLQRRGSWPTAISLAVLTAVIVALNENFLAVIGLLAVSGTLAKRVWRSPGAMRWTAISLGLALLILMYGIVPFALGYGDRSYALLEGVGGADFLGFRATASSRFGLLPNLLGLYGYWGERLGRFPTADGGVGWWPATTAVLVGLAIVGAIRSPARRWLLPVGLIGVLVSASTATGIGLRVMTEASSSVHLLGALREPQKFDVLWLIALVALAGEALGTAQPGSGRATGRAPGTAAFIMCVATLLPAGLGQIHWLPDVVHPVEYPTAWNAAADYLEAHVPPDAQVAVLPWHLYESLDFTGGRLVRNPATVLFPGRLLTSDDPEVPGEPSEARSDIARSEAGGGCDLARALQDRGIRWVIVEDAPDGARDADRLRQCGYHDVYGTSTGPEVLRS